MAKKVSFEYTAGDILSLYQMRSQDGDEKRLRTISTEMRALCRLEHEVNIPATYKAISKEFRTPFIRDSWHRITSSLVAKPPVVHIEPRDSMRKDSREAANLAEKFDQALLERVSKDVGTDIVYDLTAGLVRDGESILKVVHKPDAWANFPLGVDVDRQEQYKKGAPLPIAWRSVDRQQVVYEGGEYGDLWVLEYGEYAKPYLRGRYNLVEGETGRLVNPRNVLEGSPTPEGLQSSSNGRAVKVEFFTDREWHVLVDGTEVTGWPKPNPYSPYLPYFRAPAYDMESLLYSLMFLVPRLDELLTMKLNWSFLGAYPNPVIENALGGGELDLPLGDTPGGGGPEQPKLTWVPGKAMELLPGQKIGFLVPPPVGKDLNELITILKSLIDVAGVPAILRGSSYAGDSGYLANQLRNAAEMSYKLAALSNQRQLEKAFDFTHWIIENIVRQTVYVSGWTDLKQSGGYTSGQPTKKSSRAYLGLSPDKSSEGVARIDLLGEIDIRYRPQLITDDQAMAMIALQLTNAAKPLYGRREALEKFMQEEDADGILDELIVEQALEEEPLRSMMITEALRDAGLLVEQGSNGTSAGMGPNTGASGPYAPTAASPVPLATEAPPGMPGVPGLTMTMQPGGAVYPQANQGGGSIPGATGGRPAGAYPGQPGGPGNG